MKIAVIQSAYIPWIGFFDLIGRCDEYVIFDSAQYARRHWHNRNKIKTANGSEWLTIPVRTKGEFNQSIESVLVEKSWAEKHWRSISLAYSKAPHFQELAPLFRDMYSRAAGETHLTKINEMFLINISQLLGLATKITRDDRYPRHGQKTERLLGIVRSIGATSYLSGPSAKTYLEEPRFLSEGIAVDWMDYAGYPIYAQMHEPFEEGVSILDPIFNIGLERTSATLALRRATPEPIYFPRVSVQP